MIYLAIVLLVASYFFLFPLLLRASQSLNGTISKMTLGQAWRVLFGYVLSVAYLVALVIYTIHIDHPILIVVLVIPTLIGWTIQSLEQMAGKELHPEIVSTKKESSF